MNKLILLFLLVFGAMTTGDEHPIVYPQTLKSLVVEELEPLKAQFLPAYSILRSWEQNYCNHPQDRGKETYAGISRRFHPKWEGWKTIDNWKYKNKTKPEWNQEFPEVQLYVLSFYLDIWYNEGFDQINRQDVANLIFDARINSPRFINTIQYILIKEGYVLKEDGRLGPETINAINKLEDVEAFLNRLKANRRVFYYNIVKNNPSQEVFLKEWLRRGNYGGVVSRENV